MSPTPDEIEAFVDDPDPQAYEQLVDRLLSSPHYGIDRRLTDVHGQVIADALA